MKYIEVKTCNDCPHSDHTGAFTKGGAKPCCNHDEVVRTKGDDCFKRVIPYGTDYEGMRTARIPKKIPVWCPLPDLHVSKEVPEPPTPPLSRIIEEGTVGTCPTCKSTEKKVRNIPGKRGCINPKCPNYYDRKKKRLL